ncbi:iron export ABC transporter permease subunit FetB [Gemmatimonadetes bacterium T265]|nr:iron export ABC transporter permease subunit FetB [Gemmatimonadetes bacterium T265]
MTPAANGSGPVDVTWPSLALAAALVLVAVGVARWERLGLARRFAVGAVRATVQLVAVGYVLTGLFAADRWWLVLLALGGMLAAATHTAASRPSRKGESAAAAPGALWRASGLALLLGAGLTLAYVDAVVLRVRPWYDARYLVPLFGMILGNAMNGAALAAERLASELQLRRGEVEAWLALGASPAQATAEAARQAMTAALLPAANALAVVGIVQLPGMMTGQILAGQSPLLAVRYQLVVVFMLAGATAATAWLVVRRYRAAFFTAAEQLAERVAV